jgi:hypothetical protein
MRSNANTQCCAAPFEITTPNNDSLSFASLYVAKIGRTSQPMPLPTEVVAGNEPFMVIGAVAGG